MNYSQPRELTDKDGKPAGVWHYTCKNGELTWPVGYCAADCPGHDTKDGAYEHYRQYLLDHATYDGNYQDAQYKCSVCGAWTGSFARAGIAAYTLCDEHRNRETLDTLVKAGNSFGSW